MRALLLISLASIGCGSSAGLGSDCYNSGMYGGPSGPIPCSHPKGICESFYGRCVIPVQRGAPCDQWPYATLDPAKTKHRQCRILVELGGPGGEMVDAGICHRRKCVRAQSKGERCTPYDGKGPYCRFGVACDQGKCATD